MVTKRLTFDSINPYIRLVHFIEIPKHTPLPPRIAFDYRLMYVRKGEGSIQIENKRYEVNKGSLLLWKPGLVYEIASSSEYGLKMIGVNFDYTHENSEFSYPIPPEPQDRFKSKKITEIVHFIDSEAFNETIFLPNIQLGERLLIEMEAEFSVRKRYFSQKLRGTFLTLLGDMARYVTSTYTDHDERGHIVDEILLYIRTYYNKPLTNEMIGNHFNFHPVYINRLLVKYTGISLHQYLIQYRISQAIVLLQSTGKSIGEIALETGFSDANYFSKRFKKVVGVSPKQYLNSTKPQIKSPSR